MERFEQHTKSSLHEKAVLKLALLKQPNVLAQLDSQHNKAWQLEAMKR